MVIRVPFFDGVYELVRICIYYGHGRYQVFDQYPDGEEVLLKDRFGCSYVGFELALHWLECTGNMYCYQVDSMREQEGR